MKAVELPFVQGSNQEGLVYLLFPGFDAKDYQGVQYELYLEKGIVYVYGYEEGFEESGDAEGVGYPVAIPEEDMDLISNNSRIRVVDPRNAEASDFGSEDEYDRVQQRFDRFKENNPSG